MGVFYYGLAHWAIYISAIYLLGFLYGIAAIILVYNLLDTILSPLGYSVVKSSDIMPACDCPPSIQNNCAVLEVEKLKYDDVVDHIFTKGIRHIRRLRQCLVRPLGFWLFKDIPLESARKAVKKFDMTFKSQEEATDYLLKYSQVKIPEDHAQWELLLVEDYTKDTSLVFWKAHHVISDGIGLVMLILYLNDELSKLGQGRPTSFMGKMCSLVSPKSITSVFTDHIVPILKFPVCFMRMGEIAGSIKEDPNLKQLLLKGPKQSASKSLVVSKGYQVSDLRKVYSKYPGMKLNDLLTAYLSSAFAEHLPKVGDKTELLRGFLAVNIRPPGEVSKNPESVIFANINAPVPFQMKVSTNIEDTMKYHKGQFLKLLDKNMIKMNIITEKLFTSFSDFVIHFVHDALAKFDLAVSNVAGPKTPMYFMGKKLVNIVPFANTVGISGLTVLYFSYCEEVKIYLNKDNNLPLDCEELMRVLESKLDQALKE